MPGETSSQGPLLPFGPFLAGACVARLAARVWRAPYAVWPSGISVWMGAVVIGMLLRAVTGQTVVLPFVIVALISTGVFLLGFRAILALILRTSRKRQSKV